MRTTITIEPDLAELLKREMALGKKSLKEIVNSNLRKGLGCETKPSRRPYRIKPYSSDFVAGVDSGKLNQLADELEAMETLKRR
jgi:hypothetical protein